MGTSWWCDLTSNTAWWPTATSSGYNVNTSGQPYRWFISSQDPADGLVETRLPLPAVELRPAVLSVAAVYPPRATAGLPFTLRLRLRNDSTLPQAVRVNVSSADGFLMSGELILLSWHFWSACMPVRNASEAIVNN